MTLDISTLYAATGAAKLADLSAYESAVAESVPHGTDVTLTGPGPIWLYLRVAHKLHGIARTLTYDSPVTGPIMVFDHDPR